MKKILILVLLLVVFTITNLMSEALVLPTGTTITIPTQGSFTLDSVRFLLDRSDLENAVLAQETVLIREDQIKKLTSAYNDSVMLGTFIAIASALAAFILGRIIR